MRSNLTNLSGRLGPRGHYALRSALGYAAFAVVAFSGAIIGARLLGAEGKGAYTAWTLGAWLVAIILAGPIPVGLGRAYLGRDRSSARRVLVVHAGLAFAVGMAVVVISALVGLISVALAVTMTVALPAGVVVQDALVVMQAAKRPWAYQMIRTATPLIVGVGLAFLLVVGTAGPEAVDLAVAVFAGGTLVSAGCALLFAPGGAEPSQLLAVAKRGRGSTFANIADVLLLRIDQVFVLLLAGTGGLGVYSVAVNWSETGLYLGHAIGQSAFEDSSTLDTTMLRRLLVRAATLITIATVAILLLGWLLIPKVFGTEFAPARTVLLFLAPGIVLRSAGYTVCQVLLARGMGRQVSLVLAVCLLVGAVGWCVAIPIVGIEGAAAVSSLTYAGQLFGAWAFASRDRRTA